MMETAIVRHENGASLGALEWQAMNDQARTLVQSGFLPKAINTPEKAVAVMMTGRELGLGPMQALRSITIIEGKPALSAELIAGLVYRRVPGAVLRVVESEASHCIVEAARPGGAKPTRICWTMEDAKAAGLTMKDNWKKYPRAMLRCRAITEAARAVFPDATMGVYDPDELGAVTTVTGEVIDVEQLPRISPHGEPEDGVVYESEERVDAVLQSIVTSETLEELKEAWAPFSTPEQLEGFHPGDRQKIGQSYRRRERQLAKAKAAPEPPDAEDL
jgi:hypothetical protein